MFSKTIDLRNLDKSGWETYRFDDIAQNISERVDPNNTDLETYIGLEHIDSDSLRIKRFGSSDDVNGTKLKFYKGDIIFGRRRAYQRKAGIATMDGFCSAHALVLRANADVIDPGLFPFFLHSDLFMNRAVDISVGSLSPTINWKVLRDQEFILPPKEHQPSLIRVLTAINDVCLKNEFLISSLTSARRAVVTSDLNKLEAVSPEVKLEKLVSFKTGKLDSNAAVENGKYPFFTCSPTTLQIDRYSFDCEALLLAGNNAAGIYPLKHYKGKFDAYQRTYIISVLDENELSYTYLMEVLRSKLDLLRILSVGSSTKFLTMKVLKSLSIPVPSLIEQARIVAKATKMTDASNAASNNMLSVRSAFSAIKKVAF